MFATGVTVATVRAPDGTPHGLTVSSFTSVSLEPPLVLICIDRGCSSLAHFQAATHFAINILEESQIDLSRRFAKKTEGRFEGLDWSEHSHGAPRLAGCLAGIEARVLSTIEAGDHWVFLGAVEHAEAHAGRRPLLYFDRDYRALG